MGGWAGRRQSWGPRAIDAWAAAGGNKSTRRGQNPRDDEDYGGVGRGWRHVGDAATEPQSVSGPTPYTDDPLEGYSDEDLGCPRGGLLQCLPRRKHPHLDLYGVCDWCGVVKVDLEGRCGQCERAVPPTYVWAASYSDACRKTGNPVKDDGGQ